ncbi:hypothetical protein GCM10010992_08470 [Cloacibacterium rupense]|uniref:Rhodanese domain-containing protein n=1 Tax=Cloacibacterium rupense TaxID=517423 RepID=A0ABQ2NHN4_9FLAO|nr:rhodanese-like domain-containing protein [Cloacibacterium rupense]GGP02764.1 hypothetical protein GCM10010992_08470 [Cloacibacterium rupense]
MKRILNLLLVIVVLASCSSPKSAGIQTNSTEQKELSVKDEVAKGALMVDVRTPEEFASGSVNGAINIPLSEVESRINEFKGKPGVVVFCRSGNRSGQAKKILESNGIKNVINGINTDTINAELAK